MADQKRIVLRQGNAAPTTIVLEALPVADVASQRLTLRAVDSGTTITLAAVRANELGGRVVATEATDVAAIGGAVIVAGTLAGGEGLDIAAFSGGVLVAGDLTVTDAADTATFTGAVAAGAISGDLAATESADSFVADGRTGRSGNPARITGSARRRRVIRGAAELGQTGQSVTARGRTIQPDDDEDLVLLLAA